MRFTRRQALVAAAAALPACKSTLSQAPSDVASREVAQVFASQATRDGAGVNLKRALGHRALSVLDPFLLLDDFQSDDPNDYLAGFPAHPHRGFETVTYMIHGAMEHRDSVGNHGRLGPGAAQWMTAGKGIIHSEMPKQERGLMWGFQLWVNLPRAHKWNAPRYQDLAPGRIPEVQADDVRVRVVAGAAFGQTGPVNGIDVEPVFLDLTVPRAGHVAHALPPRHTSFLYVTDGTVRVGASKKEVSKGQLAVLSPGGRFELHGAGDGGRVLLLAGRPLGEPVARAGPFVMNSEDELRQAFDDYRSGRLAPPLL